MEPKRITKKLLDRLPAYLKYLKTLPETTVYVSATAIAGVLGLGDVQVRKDLAKISEGGRRRIGHSRERLIGDIEAIWNFAPVELKVPGHVIVQNEDLAMSLTSLRLQMKGRKR